MTNSKIQYLVTDPCYFVDDKDWDKCLDESKQNDKSFQSVLIDLLKKYSDNVSVANTGYGDWSNSLQSHDDTVKVLNKGFYADSGEVAVVKITPNFLNYLNKKTSLKELEHAAQIVESNEELKIKMDESDDEWTVVKFYDKNNELSVKSES